MCTAKGSNLNGILVQHAPYSLGVYGWIVAASVGDRLSQPLRGMRFHIVCAADTLTLREIRFAQLSDNHEPTKLNTRSKSESHN